MFDPLKFEPIYQDYLWGGRNLAEFGKVLPPGKVAESWELSCHLKGVSVIANGVWAGTSLTDLMAEYPKELLGSELYSLNINKFPLMVKLIDANDQLSVQVHPDDQYALQHEKGEMGKNEMWYILAAKPGAKLVYGLRSEVTKELLLEAINQGKVEECLNYVPVASGDVFEIPAGLVHAIGAGIVLAEIQQNSNLTYRLYDYQRRDQNGKLRELHLEKALSVIDFGLPKFKKIEYPEEQLTSALTRKVLVRNSYFVVELNQVQGEISEHTDGSRFLIYVITAGSGKILSPGQITEVKQGDTLLLPAALGEYCCQGNFEALKVYQP